jgi:hypothetical protein
VERAPELRAQARVRDRREGGAEEDEREHDCSAGPPA